MRDRKVKGTHSGEREPRTPAFATVCVPLSAWIIQHTGPMFVSLFARPDEPCFLSVVLSNVCSPAVADAVAAAAAEALPAPLAELISCSTKCMGVASVSDMALPCQSVGRVAFIGEAGCVARPHGSNALDKALADATSLTESMRSVKFTVERALPLWSLHQVQQSVALCKAAAAAGNRLQGTVEC